MCGITSSRVLSTVVCGITSSRGAPGRQEQREGEGRESSSENPAAEAASERPLLRWDEVPEIPILHVHEGPFMALLVCVLNEKVQLISSCS